MKLQPFFIFIAFSSLIINRCSTNEPFEPPASGEKLATFSMIQTQIFDKGCTISGCHAGQNPAADLNLSEGVSYDNLVNVQSILYPNLQRVNKGNSDKSVLLLILDGSLEPRMPVGSAPLSSSVTDSLKKWIDEGAANN